MRRTETHHQKFLGEGLWCEAGNTVTDINYKAVTWAQK